KEDKRSGATCSKPPHWAPRGSSDVHCSSGKRWFRRAAKSPVARLARKKRFRGRMSHRIMAVAFVLAATGVASAAEPEKVEPATESAEAEAAKEAELAALAKATQNPVADLVSIPFQNNTNFGYGPSNNKGTQNVLNIQPVVPINLTRDWNLITRTIIPL